LINHKTSICRPSRQASVASRDPVRAEYSAASLARARCTCSECRGRAAQYSWWQLQLKVSVYGVLWKNITLLAKTLRGYFKMGTQLLKVFLA